MRGACAANPRSGGVYEPPGAPNFFSKMTVFFSTHSIENFASIYGSKIHIASPGAIIAG